MKFKLTVGQRVSHHEEPTLHGVVVELIDGSMVDSDIEEGEPWVRVLWDDHSEGEIWNGQEHEDQLVPLPPPSPLPFE